MTILLSEEERNRLNIDSFERAILFSVILLKFNYNKADNSVLRNNFELTINNSYLEKISYEPQGKITIKAKLLYDKNAILSGDIRKNLFSLDGDSQFQIDPLPESINPIARMKTTPDWINSLEQFFYWSVNEYQNSILKKSEFNLNLSKLKTISIDTAINNKNEFNDYYVININLILDFDYNLYLTNGNLLASITGRKNETSLMGNNVLVGNSFLVGN